MTDNTSTKGNRQCSTVPQCFFTKMSNRQPNTPLCNKINSSLEATVPNPLKRKLDKDYDSTFKKRLTFDETYISDAEILQADTGELQPINCYSFERYSQIYFSSQFEKLDNVNNKLAELDGNVYKSKNGNLYIELQRSSKQSKEIVNGIDTTNTTNTTYFGLPIIVKNILKDNKNITELYEWQKECLTLPSLSMRNNLMYALPSSAGKTVIAELLILRQIICHKKDCLFIVPHSSHVQDEFLSMSPYAVQMEFLLEEYAAGKGQLPPIKRRQKNSVYVATIEKGLALLDSLIKVDRISDIGLIIVDEIHIIGEPGRGATLEKLLTKTMFINAGIQLVGMSSIIGNLSDFGKFLNADIYTRNFRPVGLKEFVKCGTNILSVTPNALTPQEAFTTERSVNYGFNDTVLHTDPDHLGILVNEIIPKHGVLIFCSSKKNCEAVSLLLCRVLPRQSEIHRQNERKQLLEMIRNDNGKLCPILAQTIPSGIAYHHAGLTADERRDIERAFSQNIICVICCTSTLAACVNLPAKRVIIRSPYIGREFLTHSRYKQMVNRAGRAGFVECSDSITIFESKDHSRMVHMLTAPMDEVRSVLHLSEYKGLSNMILSAIGLGIAVCQKNLNDLVSKTLLAVQANRLNLDIEKITQQSIKNLFKLKAITAMNTSTRSTILPETTDRNGKIIIKPSTTLLLNKIGKACFAASIDAQESELLYKNLTEAELSQPIHLLYIITPYDYMNNINIDMQAYYHNYNKLSPVQLQTATRLGITEACAVKLMTGQAIKFEVMQKAKRFFFTLILHHLWQNTPIHRVAELFQIDRGAIQHLSAATKSYCSSVIKFCDEYDELWACKILLEAVTEKMSPSCTMDLLVLPCTTIGLAQQLYTNGYRTLEDLATSTLEDLNGKIINLDIRLANHLISAAKIVIRERLESQAVNADGEGVTQSE